MGGAPSIQAPRAPDTFQEYSGAIQAYTKNAPALYAEESQYQPQYNAMQQAMNQSNIASYANQFYSMLPQAQAAANQQQVAASQQGLDMLGRYGSRATQAMLGTNPMYGQLQNYAQGQLGAGLDPTLQGLYGQVQNAMPGQVQGFQQIGQGAMSDTTGINQSLMGLAGKVGADTSAQDLAKIRDQVAQNQRSDIFNQTAGNIMGSLGQVDPLTQQLKTSAQQQMALGSSLSPAEAADAAQQARAAYSSRGMMMSNPAMVSEVLNRYNVGQQRLQQREQFASGVSQIADAQAQERVANAYGLTQADIAATQANQQLAGSMTQAISGINQGNIGLQSGLYGSVADNLARARGMQLSAQQQAAGTFYQGIGQAAGLQQAALGQQQQSQQIGAGLYQYLAGVGQQGLSSVLGAQPQGAQYAGMGSQLNAYGTGGPDLFQSSGVLQLAAQNQMAQMNATASANQMNAQSKGQASGAMIGAGAGIASALIVGGVAL